MGCTFLRVREDKLPKYCLLEQVVEHAAIQNIQAFIELVSRLPAQTEKDQRRCET